MQPRDEHLVHEDLLTFVDGEDDVHEVGLVRRTVWRKPQRWRWEIRG